MLIVSLCFLCSDFLRHFLFQNVSRHVEAVLNVALGQGFHIHPEDVVCTNQRINWRSSPFPLACRMHFIKKNWKSIKKKPWNFDEFKVVFTYHLNFLRQMSTTMMHTNRMAMAAADTIITARSEIDKEFVVDWWIFKWKRIKLVYTYNLSYFTLLLITYLILLWSLIWFFELNLKLSENISFH